MNGTQPPRPSPNGTAPNGAAPRKVVRKKNATNIFMKPNNQKQARWINKELGKPQELREARVSKDTNGNVNVTTTTGPQLQQPHGPKVPQLPPSNMATVRPEDRYSGFSDPRIGQPGFQFTDYKLVTTKKELLKNLRYHMMQLVGDDSLDIRNESSFPQPAHLNRRNLAAEPKVTDDVKPEEAKNELDAEGRAELTNRKEQRAKEREANLAQVAPSTNPAKKATNFKGTQQVYQRTDFTDEQKRIMQTNYEEAIPWVLEDYDSKHTLVGQNQLGAYGVHVGFAYEQPTATTPGQFRLIPIEKTYEFKPKPKQYSDMSFEEIEASFKRGAVDPEFLKEYQHRRKAEVKLEADYKKGRRFYVGDTKNRQGFGRTRHGEDGDLDFEEDFADDEEGGLFGSEEDDEEKDIKKKIKEENLQANFFAHRDEAEDDELEDKEKAEEELRNIVGKDYSKTLRKREGNFNQGSDDDYDSATDSEEERQRLEQEKAKEIRRDDGSLERGSALSSGANTPSGRKEKYGSGREDGGKRTKKRPGSPNLSDASGSDVSGIRRKKHKSKHPSRPISPDNLDPSSAGTRAGNRASFTSNPAGSDTDAAAMSDGTARISKIKLKLKQESGLSQPASRSGSPAPGPVAAPRAPRALPRADEITAKLPQGGISLKDLFNIFPVLREALKIDDNSKAEVRRLLKAAGQTSNGLVFPYGVVPPPLPNAAPATTTNGS